MWEVLRWLAVFVLALLLIVSPCTGSMGKPLPFPHF